jgi:hypothetical protein
VRRPGHPITHRYLQFVLESAAPGSRIFLDISLAHAAAKLTRSPRVIGAALAAPMTRNLLVTWFRGDGAADAAPSPRGEAGAAHQPLKQR